MKTTIDYLKFRTRSNPFKIIDAMLPAFGTCGDLITLVSAGKGRDGWTKRQDIMLTDIRIGSIDYGGESQRDWVRVDIPGGGCEWIQDWQVVQDLGQVIDLFEPTRVDIALTTFKGEVTDAMVVQAHADKKFSAWGRPPAMRSVISSDCRAGKTRYIGTREKADKFLRCYEKGFEMIKNVPDSFKAGITVVDGNKVDEIYRVELELKAANTKINPDVFLARDQYFAGAYPFCAELLPGVEHFKMDRLPQAKPVSELQAMLAHCLNSYGDVIYTARKVLGDDKVMSLITGGKHSRSLIDAGVLTMDHQTGAEVPYAS